MSFLSCDLLGGFSIFGFYHLYFILPISITQFSIREEKNYRRTARAIRTVAHRGIHFFISLFSLFLLYGL